MKRPPETPLEDAIRLVAIGRVIRPHGLLGEVSVEILTDFPGRYQPGLELLLRGPDGDVAPARVDAVRPHGGRLLVRFAGIVSVEAADELRGLDLCVRPEDAPERPPGYVFHYEVEGCTVVDRDGHELGHAVDLAASGGATLLVVSTPHGPRDVPFTHPIVVSVDLAARRIVLDPPRGLLD